MNGTADRIAAVEYTYGGYRELAPAIMRFALLGERQKTGVPKKLRYLELGFGQGLSLNIHAAGCPGEYWGTDANPTHVANAAEMAAASGADLRVFNQPFADFAARDDLPEFDIIALHGVWTWITDADRNAILDIIDRRLAVGGLCYLSYNATPGWSAAMPLRHLMTLHADLATGPAQDIGERIDGALAFAQQIADAGALYFKANPSTVERLKLLRDQAKSYLAHEFLAADWTPMAFSEVAARMERVRLSFGASAHLLDHVDALNLGPEAQKLVAGITHPVLKESVRDYVMNQQFRRDVFVKGRRGMTAGEQAEAFRALRFILIVPPGSIRFTVRGALDEATLHKAVYQPVIDALASRDLAPKTVEQLAGEVSRSNVDFSQLVQALMVLTGLGHIHPAQSEEIVAAAEERTRRLNAYFMDRAVHSGEIIVMASPVTGGGVGLARFYQIFLRARGKTGASSTPEDWAREAWRIVDGQGQRLVKEGKTLNTPEENIAELTRQATEFATDFLPLLTALRIA